MKPKALPIKTRVNMAILAFMGPLKPGDKIRTEDVIKYCQASLGGEKDEIFEIIYLSSRNTVINSERIAIGTIDRASVSPRKVVQNALKTNAAGMIFVHNHPSGEPKPSSEDIELTDELIKAAYTLGLAVHDHIIIGSKNYYNFKANGLIKNRNIM